MRLELDANEREALITALDRYTDGDGIEPGDEDRATLLAVLSRMEGMTA